MNAPRDVLIDNALWWRDHASAQPEAALHKAETWLSDPGADAELVVLARHIAGVAEVERGRMLDARHHAWEGLESAHRAGLPRRAAQLRLTLAWIEMDRGESETSWEHLSAGEPHLRGVELSRAICIRGLLHCQGDRHPEAIADLTRAAQRLRGDGDRHWLANALLARGVTSMYLYRLNDAEADLLEAQRLFVAEGRSGRAAACQHNRGCVAMRAGDLVRALRLFENALEAGLDPDSSPEVLLDRAEALAAAGLSDAAKESMRRAVDQLERHGRAVRLAETRLGLAACALRDADAATASETAEVAERLFRAQRRPGWTALARAIKWQARLQSGHTSRFALAAAKRAAVVCAIRGWTGEAAQLRLTAALVAQRHDRVAMTRKMLRQAGSVSVDADLPSPQRAIGYLAKALLAKQAGDRRDLFRACDDGLRAIDSHAAAMVAFDLRVHAFGLAADLSEIAVDAALSTGDPRIALHWTERCRVGALTRRALRPPSDPELRAALVELRAAAAELRDSQGSDPKTIRNRVTELEERVRHRAMLVDGATSRATQPCGIDEVVAALGDATLVSFFAHEEQMYAVTIMDGDVRLHRLGSESSVLAEVDRLRYFLSRQAGESSLRVRIAYSQGARHAAEEIEAGLLAPLSSRIPPGRPLVVVPTGRLHTLPWAELPSCRGRSVTVTPSLHCWLRAADDARRVRTGADQVWVSGPGLEYAEREVRSLHAMSGGRLLVGAMATTEQVLGSVDGARIAHIAAHGWFRDDQPQLSCLDLADGPLYGYDFDRLYRAPTTVVLSACEVGQSAVRRGDELSGLAVALLSRGTATVISSVVPVPDERTAEVMMSLHSGLRRGVPPATALASAQAAHGESGFLCLGYGGA